MAGALSSTPEKALASGRDLRLADNRNYESWQAMLKGESALPAEQRIDFVSIVTPNDSHFEIAHAFVQAGINVVCDKPLVHTSEQAETRRQQHQQQTSEGRREPWNANHTFESSLGIGTGDAVAIID